jgi:ABC-type branched-subunit amino acid transport system substrate-binding protein
MGLCRLRARTIVAALAGALIVLPGLAGCGSPSTPAAGGGVSNCPTQDPGVTPASVKIGLIYPDTGPAANAFASVRSGVTARIEQQNANGGVNGRRIDLVWGDDQGDPAVFSTTAQDLTDNKQAFGLIADTIVMNSANAGRLQQQGVPVTGIATSADWGKHSNLFHFGSLFNPGAAAVYGDFVRQQGGTKAMIVIDPAEAVSGNLADELAPSLRARGIQITGTISYTDATDPAHVAAQFRSSGADALVGATPTSDLINIVSQARSLGADVKVALNATGYSGGLLAQEGSRMAGLSIISLYAASDSTAMKAYHTVMNAYAPELTDPSDELGLGSYVSADEMIAGLQLAGPCPTRAAFIQSLRKVTTYDGGGLIAPADLTHPAFPDTCVNFIKVDSTGRGFAPVPPPADLDVHGFWCDGVVQ